MKIKDVIAQAEKRFMEQFTNSDGWNPSSEGSELEDKIKTFIFSTYTKDLLQSVVEMAEKQKIKSSPLGWLNEDNIEGYNQALSDIIKEIK